MAHRFRPQRMIRIRIWVMMVIVIMTVIIVIMFMPVFMPVIVPVIMTVVMIHIKPASPRTKTVAELTILNITSRG
jgi:hypothetical protein